MRKILLVVGAAALISTSLLYASAKIRPANSGAAVAPNEASAQKSGPQLPPEEVISRFTKKESELREIWKEYAYTQESKLQVLGPAANAQSGRSGNDGGGQERLHQLATIRPHLR